MRAPLIRSCSRNSSSALMIGATKPVFVIVDGHSIHKAKLVKEYVASLNGALKLFHVHAFAVVHVALGTRLVASGTSLIAAWVSGLGFGQVQTDSDISRTPDLQRKLPYRIGFSVASTRSSQECLHLMRLVIYL